MNDEGDYFAYRARVLQRTLLGQQWHVSRWLLESVLAVLAGYGYRPVRLLYWYVGLILVSTAVFTWQAYLLPCTGPVPCALQDMWGALQFHPNLVGQALAQSLVAVHRFGLLSQAPLTGVEMAMAAFDAVAGLVIEATFVATFVQRFFAR